MQQPCKDKGGYRQFGKVYNDKIHTGHDYNCGYRSDVKSASNGKVILVKELNGFGGSQPRRKGWCIMIESNTTLLLRCTVIYGHVIPAQHIEEGYNIKQGEHLGEIDHYYIGEVDYPHLHFGAWLGGSHPETDDNNGLGYVESLRDWINPSHLKYLV